jgi:glycosyltransferase involved in cell wall biosynthesis
LSKYQRLSGHESKVIICDDSDKYGIKRFYREYSLTVKPEEFLEAYLAEAESADVIHVHSMIGFIIRTRMKYHRSKKIILHYHGSEIRRAYGRQARILSSSIHLSDLILNPKEIASKAYSFAMTWKMVHVLAQKLADVVLVASPELLQFVQKEKGIYIPFPVDTDHFKGNTLLIDKQKEALTINTEVSDIQHAIDYWTTHGIKLDIEIYHRAKFPIMYADMPSFLNRYKVYVDIRFVNEALLQHHSGTALQSLACGLKVLDYQLKLQQGMPAKHDPKNVVSVLSTIYSR